MRNVRILVASLLFFISSVLTAQVRESVVLVRPNPGEDRTAAFRNIADFFRKRNFGDLADYFEANSKNTGFGSGFLTRDPYGRLVAVTNRHVTAFSTAAKVTVTREDGTERAFPDCPVIYEDPDMDIAVLLLPQDVGAGARILRLADSVPVDGEEVWTAGYPGLFERPTWQLAKGNISNRRVIMEVWGPPEYEVYTQHSAPIDPGNSGGPLLTGDPRNPESLRVVGVNTWMVQGRQNANFAVHLDRLRESLGRIPDPGKPIDPLPVVRSKTERIVEGINSNTWNQSDSGRYISTRLAMRQGWGSFLALSTSGAEAEAWVLRFLSSPEETMREAVYHRIFRAIRGKGQAVSLASVEERTDPEGVRFVRTALSAGSNTYYLDWYEETGNWRIRSGDVDVVSKGENNETPVDSERQDTHKNEKLYFDSYYQFPFGWLISIHGSSVPYFDNISGQEDKASNVGFKVGFHFGIGQYASLGLFTSLESASFYIDTNDSYPEGSEPVLKLPVFEIGAELRFGYPIPIKNLVLFPFLEGVLRTDTIMPDSYEIWAGSTILNFGLMIDNDVFTIGLSVGKTFPSFWEDTYSSPTYGYTTEVTPVYGWNISVFIMFL